MTRGRGGPLDRICALGSRYRYRVAKPTPWWKQTPVAAPDAPRAVRPDPEEQEEDVESEDVDDVEEEDEVEGADEDEGADHEGAVTATSATTSARTGVTTSATPSAATSPNDLADGESTTVQGSGAQPYVLRNTGGVYSCSCPAWRNQSAAIERRSCKHLRKLRGDAVETARVGAAAAPARAPRVSSGSSGGASAPVAAGGVTVAPPILLAHPWDHTVDLTGWWMSEKLDGVRAYWDGERFLSRLGNQYHAPDWFISGLPRGVVLDGELWAGRKKFQRGVSIARRQDKSDDWRELTYVIFDAPAFDGPFEERLSHVRELVEASGSRFAVWHPHERCTGLDHLRAELARVEQLGGEGLMMRQPSSRYEVGRSWTLRKVKTFHDAEAQVVAHVRGTGKHAGRLGSLQCQMPNGTLFNVGTGLSDAERNNPPPVGTIVTYRYQELSADGVPRFPSYVGVRDDVAWPPSDAPASAPARTPAPARAPAPMPASSTSRTFQRGAEAWSVELDGRTVIVRHGTESTRRQCADPASAWRDADRLIAEKLRDGYVEIVP